MGNKKLLIYLSIPLIALIVYCSLYSFGYLPGKKTVLKRIKQDGALVVLTRNAPTTYYQGPQRTMGFEYDLTRAFADYIGVNVEFVVLDSISQIIKAIKQGKGDIAAAALTRTEKREDSILFGTDYRYNEQLVVARRWQRRPKKIEDLSKFNIMVIKDSSYEETLNSLKPNYPDLKWETSTDLSTEQILKKVWLRELNCTIADSDIFAINRRYYPELLACFPLTGKQPMAWGLNPKRKYLKRAVKYFMDDFKRKGYMAELEKRYYNYVKKFDYVDTKVFHRRINERLPLYQPLFIDAGQKFNIFWTLLAAQAYQESHWDDKAISPTGVRGIMMLTRLTADSLGVKNRLDPLESILGGAQYMSSLLHRVPKKIEGDNRIWFALAAYNVGMGHMYDAQKLARSHGKDAYSWNDLKTVLPLLSQKKYYKTLKYGYARGEEPVRYVEQIRYYHNILENHINTKRAVLKDS